MSEDVMEYPIHASQQDIQVDREENINYRDGILLQSNGTTQVSSKGNILSNASTFSDSNGAADIDLDIFMVHGYFSMELQVCRLVPHATRKRRETNRRNLASGLSCEESLMAGFNESKNITINTIILYTTVCKKLKYFHFFVIFIQSQN